MGKRGEGLIQRLTDELPLNFMPLILESKHASSKKDVQDKIL